MSHTMFLKTFVAGAAVAKRRIVKFDAAGLPVQASAATDALIGISDQVGDIAIGGRIDVHMAGQPEVEAGGEIAAGAAVTADTDGKAVEAAAGETAIGFAVEGADVDGDIIAVHLARHTIPNAGA